MPAPPIPIFQSNKIAILLGNIILTDQISKWLQHHFTAPPLQEYLQGKSNWSTTTFNKIDSKYLKRIPRTWETHESHKITTWLATYEYETAEDSR